MTLKEMLNILSHQRNENQNNFEIPSYSCKNGQDQKHWWQLMLERMWIKGNTRILLMGVQICRAALEINMEISEKIRKQRSSRPNNTTFGYVPKGCSIIPQGHVLSYVHISIHIVIARNWKQPRCPSTEEWTRKMWYIYIMGYYSVVKINDILIFSGKWMDLEKAIIKWGDPRQI